jgi:hypothetical protein
MSLTDAKLRAAVVDRAQKRGNARILSGLIGRIIGISVKLVGMASRATT